MIIEVLDSQGGVIARVANTDNPNQDVALYNGTSWRVYVPSDTERVEALRAAKISATKSEGMNRIGVVIPALANKTTLDLLVEMLQAGMVTAPTPGTDMDRVKSIYVYVKQVVTQMQTATEAQLNAYDPATDPNWPV